MISMWKPVYLALFVSATLSACFAYHPPQREPYPERIMVYKTLPEGLNCTLKKADASSISGFGCGRFLRGQPGSYEQSLYLLRQDAHRAKANAILIKEVLYPPQMQGCERSEVQIDADFYQCAPAFAPDAP